MQPGKETIVDPKIDSNGRFKIEVAPEAISAPMALE